MAGRLRTACAPKLLLLLLLLFAMPAVVQAQFTFTTNIDGTLNIYQYTGDGGDVIIPDTTPFLITNPQARLIPSPQGRMIRRTRRPVANAFSSAQPSRR